MLGAELGGVAPGTQRDDVGVGAGLRGGRPVSGQVGEVERTEGVVAVARVVVRVGRRLAGLCGEGEQVELIVWLGGVGVVGVVGGVGDVGVDAGGVVGEQFNAVGEQSRAFVGAQVFGFVDVAQVFGGRGEQIAR